MKVSSTPDSLPKTSSYESLPSEPKGYLSGPVKKYIVTALCIGGAIATREALGFQNTAIAITLICTAFGFTSIGFVSLFTSPELKSLDPSQLNTEDEGKNRIFETCKEVITRIQKNAVLGGVAGLITSLGIIAIFESSFQMLQTMKGFID